MYKCRIITGVSVVKHPTMPTFVLFMVNTNDGNTKLFNSGSAVIFKLDTTVGISCIPFKYDKRVLIPWSNS